MQAVLTQVMRSGYRPLLQPGPGAGDITRNRPARDGFVVLPGVDVRGDRILLVDDTYTTGATLQSAAHALARAGAEVEAAVVVGRKVNYEGYALAEEVWRRASRTRFDWTLCCASQPSCIAPPF
jgi:hypothetical protein